MGIDNRQIFVLHYIYLPVGICNGDGASQGGFKKLSVIAGLKRNTE